MTGKETPARILLAAPAGFGKTYYCLEQFKTLLRSAPDLTSFSSYFLVPTQEHADRLRDVLLRDPAIRIIGRAYVNTLDDFIRTLLGEAEHTLVTDVLKNVFIKDILHTLSLDYFSSAKEYPGFVERLSDFVGEVKESGLTMNAFIERLDGIAATQKGDASFSQKKYQELGKVLLAYEKRLALEGLRDVHDVSGLMRDRIRDLTPYLEKIEHIFIDGFLEFTPMQEEVLAVLARSVKEMTVTLTSDAGKGNTRFESPARTQKKLLDMGFTLREDVFTQNERTDAPDLRALEHNLFHATREADPNPPEHLMILEGHGVREELEMIAREIRRLYATGTYHFSDFCLIFRRIGSYAPMVESVFGEYDLPVAIHERSMLRGSGFVTALVSLLDIFDRDWQREDVFRFLYGGWWSEGGALAHHMERFVYQEGFSGGRAHWFSEWPGFPEEWEEKRKAALEKLAALEQRFHTALTAEHHMAIVRELVTEHGREKLFDAQAIRRLLKVMDEVRFNFRRRGNDQVLFEEFSRVFRRAIEVSLFSEPVWGRNRVQVYDILIARQKEFKVVFVPALLERSFPREMTEDPILKDAERRAVNKGGRVILEERMPRQALERYLFYMAVTRACERLYLSYSRHGMDGKECQSSFYLEDVKKCFKSPVSQRKQSASEAVPSLENAATPRELERAAMHRFFQASPNIAHAKSDESLTRELVRALSADAEFGRRVADVYQNRARAVWDARRLARLTSEQIQKRFAEQTQPMSATRLETYGACPFRYFLHDEVKLKEPEEEISMRIVGSALHKALELFAKSGGYEKSEREARTVMDKSVEKALIEHPIKGGRRYQIELMTMEVYELASRFLDDWMRVSARSSLRPTYFEHTFGFSDEPLDLGNDESGKPVRVRGVMDRVDIDPVNGWAAVVDFKYGKQFSLKDMDEGLMLQLPIYATALEERFGLKPAAAYLMILNRLGTRKAVRPGVVVEEAQEVLGWSKRARGVLSGEAFRALREQGKAFARAYAGGIRKAAFPVYPKDCVSYCKFHAVCRIEPWMLPRIGYELATEKRK